MVYNLKKEESKEHKTEKTASGQKKAESKQVAGVHSACRRVLGELRGAGVEYTRKWWERSKNKALASTSRTGRVCIHWQVMWDFSELIGGVSIQLSFHFLRELGIMLTCLAIMGLCWVCFLVQLFVYRIFHWGPRPSKHSRTSAMFAPVQLSKRAPSVTPLENQVSCFLLT